MDPLEPQRDQYTVGWVCALPIEAAVAKAMLDKHYRPLPSEYAYDSNNYALGSIGEHNVVIASLPMGVCGTTSAATTATNMLASFPNIRFGLLVGIGGGIPSGEHDIRLGDVVVSKPHGTFGGVVQIDLGKMTSTGFKRTGSLNQPPVVLLAALAQLEADHILGLGKVPLYLSEMYGKYPALRKPAGYLGPEFDKLFHADYNHAGGASCQDCDVTLLINREPRENEDPLIHYGTIASGNQVIKDSTTRDRLQREHGVLCFEMEAAGIMNNFPCLVIRGICDYSDSHKNKSWQGYAAAIAAAFSKELLCTVPALQVDSTRRAMDVLQGISAELTNISSHMNEAKADKHSEKITRWLSPADPSANYNRALENRHPGSGAWLIGSEMFSEWKTNSKGSMWLHGLPGCGKTVLSASIIEDLQRGGANVAKTKRSMVLYFYFDFSDQKKQLLDHMARSLVSQLYHQDDDSRKPLDVLFSSCKNGHEQPTTKSLLDVFLQMLHTQTGIYLVIDALDECTSRKDLLCWIRAFAMSQHDGTRWTFTSRKEEDIESCLSRDSIAEHRIAIRAGPVNKDIQAYIHARLHSDNEFERWRRREAVQSEIEEKLIEKADGMFRWATCQLDALAKCTDRRMLQKALDCLPTTLHETYDRILAAIPAEYKSNAIRMLQFLVYSENPLSIEEMIDAIAVDIDDEPHFDAENRMPKPKEIAMMCSNLVTMVEDEKPYLRLAHFSVQQYLISDRIEPEWRNYLSETNANAANAKVCIAYCCAIPKGLPRAIQMEEFPFAQYSARNWVNFAAVAESRNDNLRMMIEDFFLRNHEAFHNWLCLHNPEASDIQWDVGLPDISAHAGPLYYASLSGFSQCVRALLSSGVEINALRRNGDTALCAASKEGHVEIVKLLLDSGAALRNDTGAPQKWQTSPASPIRAAVTRGQKAIVKMLLDHGADVNEYDKTLDEEDNLLLQAVSSGYDDGLPRLLLEYGVNMKTQGGPALGWACHFGLENIVKILLDKGALVAKRHESDHLWEREGPLVNAACEGHYRIVQLLINKGADVRSPGEYYRDALDAARGHSKTVQVLLENGARDISLEDKDLLEACTKGDEVEVRLLLDKGANANARQGNTGSALNRASWNGHAGVVQALIDKGANIQATSRVMGGSPLHNAARSGCLEAVDILIRAGSDLATFDIFGRSPLYVAIALTKTGGIMYADIAKSLIRAGADPECGKRSMRTPLILSAEEGNIDLLTALMNVGANVKAQDGDGHTALHGAAQNGHVDIVTALVDAGVNLEAHDGLHDTALHCAAERGHLDVVKTLIDAGSNLEAQDVYGNTALHRAANGGHLDTVKVLVGAGVAFYRVNDDGETPLDSAEKVLTEQSTVSIPRSTEDLERAERCTLLVAWIRSYQRGEVDVDS